MYAYSPAEVDEATENYDEARLLGTGGFGSVYAGEPVRGSQGQRVAVKRLLLSTPPDKKKAKMKSFTAELKAAEAVPQHECLVEVLGTCNTKADELILVYMPCAKVSLATALLPTATGVRSYVIKSPERVKVALCVARGLDALHVARQVHLDIKSANVLLVEEPGVPFGSRAVLGDMGVSAGLEGDADTITFSPPEGDYIYWAPEYAAKGEASLAADVYCFGLILLELYMGTLLYLKPGFAARAAALFTAGKDVSLLADSTVTWDNGCRDAFAQLAGRCLQDNRYDRPTAAECVVALTALATTSTPAAATPELSAVRQRAEGSPPSKPGLKRRRAPLDLCFDQAQPRQRQLRSTTAAAAAAAAAKAAAEAAGQGAGA